MTATHTKDAATPRDGLDAPVSILAGVTKRMASALTVAGLRTVWDLCLLAPLRYEDRTCIVAICDLRPGESVLVEGEVSACEQRGSPGRRQLVIDVHDGTGVMRMRFFHVYPHQERRYAVGTRWRWFGTVRRYDGGLEMTHPETEAVGDVAVPLPEVLSAVYPKVEGVSQATLRRVIAAAVAYCTERAGLEPRDHLPMELEQRLNLSPLALAVAAWHQPRYSDVQQEVMRDAHPARRRLAFEELLAHHLSVRRLRESLAQWVAPKLAGTSRLVEQFLAQLPFKLTAAQQRVLGEIERDLARLQPMHRLIQGDVGCGKTLVAAVAMLRAVESGYQAALLAPTELLAEQHGRNLTKWFGTLGLSVGVLTNGLSAAQKRHVLTAMSDGSVAVVVGTHALFQDGVTFDRLALMVIDEQHRFGVHQRLAMREKGSRAGVLPHQLVMTATPIPRTLAMTAYADLDVSIIDELPPGRKPVVTVALPVDRRDEVIARISHAHQAARQVYWVCTQIDESEDMDCQAAVEAAEVLRGALPQLSVGLIHGRLKPAEKDAVMAEFVAGRLHVMVATTVIEVGVDVPNASLMVIENAERLGLAQLHQLRGRVGRGSAESVCVLLYQGPLSEHSRARLAVMRQTNDGFLIAQRDLEIRGPGEFLGTRQSGAARLRVADWNEHGDMMTQVTSAAETLLREYPERVPRLINRWLGTGVHYADV